MEIVSFKMDEKILNDIDGTLQKHRYNTRTEFIRDAIRDKLNELEKEEVIKRLTAMKGSLKRKSKMSPREARELVWQEVAKKHNLPLK